MVDDAYTRNEDGELAVRTVSTSGDTGTNPNDVFTRDDEGRLAIRTTGGGGGDQHNLGYFATQAALEEAHPTAEAGDWAIVGATDTVWVWDSDNSQWVDSDQKGQVTSVNGQTGTVVLTASDVGALPSTTPIPDFVQYSTMPTASADNLGDIVQFTGTTDANYTNGYFYKCTSAGDPVVYSWTQVDVQPTPVIPDPLPSQTGQSGKFLTTDGTDASWSDKPLVNTATGTNSLTIFGTASTGADTINIGRNSTTNNKKYAVAIGNNAQTKDYNAIAIGRDTEATYDSSVAVGNGAKALGSGVGVAVGIESGSTNSTVKCSTCIGAYAKASASYAIEINASDTPQKNAEQGTLCVGLRHNNSGVNYKLLDSDGTVPTARLTKVNTTATLAAADWSSNTQTVTVSGVKADSVVFVSPAPASASDYASAGILCTAQAADSLTFTATTTPTNAITVNVVCF